MNVNDCIEKGFLTKIKPDAGLCNKEVNEADYDLNSAEKAFKEGDYKWCIIKCYYSMFHSAKAILFKLGYTEKKHIAVIIVLEDLNKKGKVESKYINDFKAAMSAREDADYSYSYSKETAEYNLEIAEGFLKRMKKLLKEKF